MVQIRYAKDCDCFTCSGGESEEGHFGGWTCSCQCHHKKERKEMIKKILLFNVNLHIDKVVWSLFSIAIALIIFMTVGTLLLLPYDVKGMLLITLLLGTYVTILAIVAGISQIVIVSKIMKKLEGKQ